ncbi:MAG: DUF6298 domain-containing protein [Mariniphaga sp.]|nr:DUF6298 domain-containing protein [Mariniphaga sp.]
MMNKKYNVVKLWGVIALFIHAGFLTTVSGQPLALHPENNHYFIWEGMPAILITSGEHYGAVLNLDFDYERYLDALAADGLNNTRIFSGTYREVPSSFGITNNTLAPKTNRYACPWARSSTPGYFDGTYKFDLSRFDPAYFDRLKNFMTAARDRGIIVEMVLFCPFYGDAMWEASPMNAKNNINGVGNCPRDDIFMLKHPEVTAIHEAFTQKIVRELNEFDNLYYEVLNESWAGGVSNEWEHHMVDVIKNTEDELPNQHLISLNIEGSRNPISHTHPDVSIYTFHGAHPPRAVELNYGLNKVIGENETGFRGSHDLIYRTEGWAFILAGGAIYNNLDYSFTPDHPDGTFLKYKSPGGGSPALRKQLSILKEFMGNFNLIRMKPDPDIVKSISEEMTSYVLADPGEAYALYCHVPLPWKPEDPDKLDAKNQKIRLTLDLPNGKYKTEWWNTKTGNKTVRKKWKHKGGEVTIESPEFIGDIALKIVSK